MKRFALVILWLALPCPAQEGERHWAFVAPRRPPVPRMVGDAWSNNTVDAFVREELQQFGLEPSPRADRATLARRACFDLTGLPPDADLVASFVDDTRPGAFERLVDRLLASPAFGERWAQHWLDLARHADTDGFEFDAVRPDAWRYRDWVVRALNADMPYSQFVAWQTGGDILAPDELDAWIATGFHRGYPDMVDLNDQALRRQNALNDITETTGLVFLGLTIGCARCHDHKADPIPQLDFYRLQAYFTGARFRDDFPVGYEKEGDSEPRRAQEHRESLAALERQIEDAGENERSRLAAELARLKKQGPKPGPTARVLAESDAPRPETFVLIRGEFGAHGERVHAGVPTALTADLNVEHGEHSPADRAGLARWLSDAKNPLTARVAVNRVWQYLFGRGLVASSSDFGLSGEPPSHPELLDWLACELVRQDWSLKAIIRLLITSETYQQSARFREGAGAIDPENVLLWRHTRRRLDGEELRDALLATSGLLRRAMGGPGVFPALPRELAALNAQGMAWPATPDQETTHRRSLYVFVRRNLRFPMFEAFDRPDTNASCARRPSSTTAPQALALLNGRLSTEAARALAARVRKETGQGTPDHVVEAAILAIFGRAPAEAELNQCRAFLDEGGPLEDLCLALLNTNTFLYLD